MADAIHSSDPNITSTDPTVDKCLVVYQFLEKRGWPTMLVILGIAFMWFKVVPIIDRVADSHIAFVEKVRQSNEQTTKTLIILEERDRKRGEEFRVILDRLTNKSNYGRQDGTK